MKKVISTYRRILASQRARRRYIRPALIVGVALLVLLLTTSPVVRQPIRAAGAPVRVPTAVVRPPPTLIAIVPTPARIAAALPVATPQPAAAQPAMPAAILAPGIASTSPAAQVIDRYVSDLVSAGLFQGVVLVARDGQVVLNQGYGFADRARRVPNTPQTRFQLASMTKQFTAAAIMLLKQRGQLSLQDPICNYLADCPVAWRAITIEQLLNHTSGLPNYTDLASFDATQMIATTPDELVSRFRELPLLFPPGSRYMYENSDYVLLGQIIQRVSGRPYADMLSDTIFVPLGMRDTGAAQRAGDGATWAVGYRVLDEPAPILEPSTLFAAGELYSTSQDLYRWAQALETAQLLPQPLLREMWTPARGNYGYGWKVGTLAGHRQISHPGLMDGFASTIALYPDDGLTVIVLCNMSAADIEGIGDYVATLVFGS